jgi:hypothetical protein
VAAGGYTRQPNAFNDGWRARFWLQDYAGNGTQLLTQGAGLPNLGIQSPSSNIFGPHLWPFGNYLEGNRFVFELECVRPAGCDRGGYNATDANGFVFVLGDEFNSQVALTNTSSALLQGTWTRGTHEVDWNSSDLGSGLRVERLRIDGTEHSVIDYQATGHCDLGSSQINGEWARPYQPCRPPRRERGRRAPGAKREWMAGLSSLSD